MEVEMSCTIKQERSCKDHLKLLVQDIDEKITSRSPETVCMHA